MNYPQNITLHPVGFQASSLAAISPTLYDRSGPFTIGSYSTAAGRRSLLSPLSLGGILGSMPMNIPRITIDADVAANWDSISPTNFSIAANRAGKNFYVYLTPRGLVLSNNSTVPAGFDASNSRMVGGFHGLCLSVGNISGHTLSGFVTGDIIPMTIWDIKHRSSGLQDGTVYVPKTNRWWMIYLQSGTGVNTASVFGATITDTRTWMDHCDDLAAVGMELPSDQHFQIAAEGSNQLTNISGSADPVTAGGHIDTAGRRMISNDGLEDCCGAMWQWLSDQGYQNDATYAPTFAWNTLPGSKGSLYRQGATGDVKLRAGGAWNLGSACGSRCRHAYSVRWDATSTLGARGCAWSHAQ